MLIIIYKHRTLKETNTHGIEINTLLIPASSPNLIRKVDWTIG